jgi:hypothetical protein
MKSKETETPSPDPIQIELSELKMLHEYSEDQVRLGEETIGRLEHIRKIPYLRYIVYTNTADRKSLLAQIQCANEEILDLQNQAKEAELLTKRKEKMVNDLTAEVLEMMKKLKTKDNDIERAKFLDQYEGSKHEDELEKMRVIIKKLGADLKSKQVFITRLKKDLKYWRGLCDDSSVPSKFIDNINMHR